MGSTSLLFALKLRTSTTVFFQLVGIFAARKLKNYGGYAFMFGNSWVGFQGAQAALIGMCAFSSCQAIHIGIVALCTPCTPALSWH